MRILWDEAKRKSNLAKHGLDFRSLTIEFFEASIVFPAKGDRFLAIGNLGGQTIAAVVFRPLGTEAISVISMRPASRKERTSQCPRNSRPPAPSPMRKRPKSST